MMAIIIGKNHVSYTYVAKKDLTKHFFKYRNQFYPVYPDELTPIEVYHDGAWVRSESAIVFSENVGVPLNVKHPDRYQMDAVLSSIDEHKLMARKKRSWVFDFNPKKLLDYLPLIALGFIGLVFLTGMF